MGNSPIDFSSIGGKKVESGKLDFSSIGGKPVEESSSFQDESKLTRFGKAAYGMTPLPLIEPPKPEEAASYAAGGPGGLAAERLIRGTGSLLGQIPRAIQHWSERIPGARGIVPAKPLGQTLDELKSVWPELAGMAVGGLATARLGGKFTRPTAAEKAAFVPKGLKRIGKGTGIPYSETAVTAAERVGTLAPKGAARESLLAARDLDVAKKDLAKIGRDFPANLPKGAEGTLARANYLVNYMDDLWNKSHKAPIERYAEIPLDNKVVFDAINKSIPQEAIDNAPAEAKAAHTWATRNFLEPKTIGSADRLLREINDDLKSPAAQTAYSPLMLRTKQIAAGVLREQIDTALEKAGEAGVKESNKRWGALRNVAQYMAESALTQAERDANTSLFQKALHTYGYVSPRSIIPHGGMAISSRAFSRAPSTHIAKGFKMLGRSGISPEPPPTITPAPSPPAPQAPPPTAAKKLPPMPEIKSEAYKPSPPPEPKPTPPPVVDKYAKTREAVSYTRMLDRAAKKLTGSAKKGLTDAEIAWIEKETGLDLTDPANTGKALIELRKKRAALMKGLPPVPTVGNK